MSRTHHHRRISPLDWSRIARRLARPRRRLRRAHQAAHRGAGAGRRSSSPRILASPWGIDRWVLLHTVLGAALVAASAGAFNQWWEQAADARMPRTASRPLPAGRLSVVASRRVRHR